MKLLKEGSLNRLKISKNEWVKIGRTNNWLQQQEQQEQNGNNRFGDIHVEASTSDFYNKGMFFEWSEKQQLLRAYRSQGDRAFVETIRNHPKQFPLVYSFNDELLMRAYAVIAEKEADYANPNQGFVRQL